MKRLFLHPPECGLWSVCPQAGWGEGMSPGQCSSQRDGAGRYKESRPPNTRAVTWSAMWPGARHPSAPQSPLGGELGASRDWRQGKDGRASRLEGAWKSRASPLPVQVSLRPAIPAHPLPPDHHHEIPHSSRREAAQSCFIMWLVTCHCPRTPWHSAVIKIST